MQERIDAVNRVLREQITGIRVVRAFVREPEEIERFGIANARLADASLRVGRVFALMFPVVMGITNVTMVAIIWVGGHQIVDGNMEIGALTMMTIGFREREMILDFFEAVTGLRMNHAYIRPGGVATDLPETGIAQLIVPEIFA